MTDNNTVTAGTGIVSGGRYFTSANSEYFTRADNAAFQLASSQTIALWFYLTSNGTNQVILARDVASGAYDYFLRYEVGGGLISFGYRYSAGPLFVGPITVIPSFSFGTWYCLSVKWNGTNLFYSVNGAAYTSTSAPNAPITNASASPIIGANRASGSPGIFMNGRMDILTYWKGTLLTDAEIATFYNAGAGHEYSGGAWV